MASLGTVIRFDELRGYGFIAPEEGGEDVFVHANDFGGKRHLAQAGLRVMFETAHTERGPKISSLTLLDDGDDPAATAANAATAAPAQGPAPASRAVDDECDVLTAQAYSAEVTELLLTRVPSLTGQQIVTIREHLARLASGHGWIDG